MQYWSKEYHVLNLALKLSGIEWCKLACVVYSVDCLDDIYDKLPELKTQYVWYSLRKEKK